MLLTSCTCPARPPLLQNTIWVLNDWEKMCKRKYFGKMMHLLNAKSYTKAFDEISMELFMAFQVGGPGTGAGVRVGGGCV